MVKNTQILVAANIRKLTETEAVIELERKRVAALPERNVGDERRGGLP